MLPKAKFSIFNFQFSISEGFTLIELLVVIAVLGVLAAGVLAAINPGERLAQARDSQRKAAIGQLAQAMQTYYVTQASSGAASYIPITPIPPGVSGGAAPGVWMTKLVTANELKAVLPAVNYSSGTACNTRMQNNYCYDMDSEATPTIVVVYTTLESGAEKNKCSAMPALPVGQTYAAYFLWSSAMSRAGTVCVNSAANVYGGGSGNGTGYTFYQ